MVSGERDELLELAKKALRQARPKRRRLGVVDHAGNVETIIEDDLRQPDRKSARVFNINPRGIGE